MTAQFVTPALVLIIAGSVLYSRVGLKPAPQILALLAVIVTEFFALAGIMSYAAGNPPFTNPDWLKAPAWFVFACALTGVALLGSPHAVSRLRLWFFGVDSVDETVPVTREEKQALAILVMVGVVAFAGGLFYLRRETSAQRDAVVSALQTMSALKVRQIERWRVERFADVDTMTRIPSLADLLRLKFAGVTDSRLDELGNWARSFVKGYGYARLVLFDAEMKPIYSHPSMPDLELPALRDQLRTPPADAKVVELKPYVDGAGRLRLDFLVPLRPYKQSDLTGFVLLQTDPAQTLFPTLAEWPPEYASGQTALWQREGDTMISLGGMRPAPGVTEDEIKPLGSTRTLASMAPGALGRLIFGSTIEAAEGPDRRGSPIIGVGGPIPNSTWAFSTRLDSRDAYAKVRQDALVIAGLTAGLFIGTGMATGRLSRQRQRTLGTERMAAELDQKRTAARLGMVMQQAKDIILVTDDDLRIVEMNAQAITTYGRSREELLGMTARDLRDPAASTDYEALAGSSRRAGGVFFETSHRRKDGSTFPVEINARQIEIDGGTQLVAIIRDISERRRAEAELRASEERYRLIAENTSDVIWLYDLIQDAYIYLSPSVLTLRGFTVEEGLQQKLTAVSTPEGNVRIAELLKSFTSAPTADANRGDHVTIEIDLVRRDGTLVPTEVGATVLRDTAGRAHQILGVTRNITERRRAQETEDALAKLDRERVLSGMKSQFISVASHEFRTPLAAAVGSLELLERHAAKLTEAKRLELLGRIQKSLSRLTTIMDDVLQLSRADSGRVQVNRMTVDLVRFVQDILQEVATGDRQQHVFAFEQSGGPGVVPVDTKLLHHIVSNLLGNAARYSPAGTSVSLRLDLAEAGFTLTVADEGIGVPEAERNSIFEPFVRGSNVGQIGGTGLGLNIVKRYTELMGGRIELLPTARGAAFRVHIPYPASTPAP